MEAFLRTLQADLGSLDRFYRIQDSDWNRDRLRRYYQDKQKELARISLDTLDRDGKADYLLTERLFRHRLRQIELAEKRFSEIAPLLPFAPELLKLIEQRQSMQALDPVATAATLEKLREMASELPEKAEKSFAFRAAESVDRWQRELKEWFEFYHGYDPQFGWWCRKPYEQLTAALAAYSKHLKEKLVGIRADDPNAIVGAPVGREALLEDLKYEEISYTPEELIEIARKEYAWCEAEMKKAAKELGYSQWRDALEHVKRQHVSPGQQPQLIKDLAVEAIDFVEKHDLVSVPDLAKETWRMQMMSPERQKVSPFFLGGESIIVSFPTDTMTQNEKMMSLRANNIHFARATVHHELIPGHHLQGFMGERYRNYRRSFSTPFWTEGWALWFEFLLWDLGFPKTPENRIGMLFWRMHRCVRIEFSLGFHLGKLTPEECIKMLVERVGHEPSTAEGEVRRSFGGQYPPLYQAAYMLGALQFRALSKELVDTKMMSRKQFHDATLRENNIPIAMLRAILSGKPLTRDLDLSWKFYE